MCNISFVIFNIRIFVFYVIVFNMSKRKIYLIESVKNQIMGSKLPSIKDCLSVLFFNLRLVKLNLNESAALVIDECLIYWKKARIPTHDRLNYIKKLKKNYEDWRTLEKNSKRTGDLYKQREKNFVDCLNDLFDISHANAVNMMKNKEDIAFLNLQRQKGRPGCMVGKDLILPKAEKITEDRSIKTNTNFTLTTELESGM